MSDVITHEDHGILQLLIRASDTWGQPLAVSLITRAFRAGKRAGIRQAEAEDEQFQKHLYSWLVEVLGFPFDMTVDKKPVWLDVHRLAEAWRQRDLRQVYGTEETVDDYVGSIYMETGWQR